MRLGIMGTRGIPNNYGGFEQFAEYLSHGLVKKGHEVFVYNSHTHPYKENTWNGVTIIHKQDPEDRIGTAGQFIYDLNCIIDSRKRKFDALLNLGYTSSSVWGFLFPRKTVVITNMDGLEWKRTKYNPSVRKFLMYAEKLAVHHSDVLIADSVGIQNYLKEKYAIASDYIPYGANIFHSPDAERLTEFGVSPKGYNLLIARMEPENNIEVILDGIHSSSTEIPFLVIGNYKNKFGMQLVEKFGNDKRIRFMGPIYDSDIINNLRYFSNLYFHGHSVGGTNPSLLEAMGSGALIAAHNNEFNRYVLREDGFYFSDSEGVKQLVQQNDLRTNNTFRTANNFEKIKNEYSWDTIVEQYEQMLLTSIKTYDRK